ncbi:hypothetical protein P7C73_g389, partial [Tremellales sp. Uapishka_1]
MLSNDIGGADQWLYRIDATITDLSQPRRPTLGVYGDRHSAPEDVVSALLQDPLVDSQESRRLLLARHEDINDDLLSITYVRLLPSMLTNRYSPEGKLSSKGLSCPASFLRVSGLDVVEVRAANADQALSSLLLADVVLLVLNPTTLLSSPFIASILPSLLSKGHLHLLINGHLPPRSTQASVTAELMSQLDDLSPSFISPSISFVRAEKALRALDALAIGLDHEGPSLSSSKTHAFDVFQSQFLRSNIGPFQSALLDSIPKEAQQLSTAKHVAESTLDYMDKTISIDRTTTRSVSETISLLRRSAMQATSKAKNLSVVSRGIEGGVVEGDIQHDLHLSRTELEDALRGRLNWLGLIGRGRVDDVGLEVGDYLEKQFARGVEQQLIFETGQLALLQTSLEESADKVLRRLSSRSGAQAIPVPHPFSSSLLLNHLSSLSLSIPPLLPDSFLDPIHSRRRQLLDFSVPRLQLSAQRALLSTYAISLGGTFASWLLYVPPFSIVSGSTAAGLGILCVLSSLLLGQRLWERSQKRFWRDWDRITKMLKGDLQVQFSNALETQVLAKPTAAADGLEQLVAKREGRLDELQSRIEEIRRRIYPAQ